MRTRSSSSAIYKDTEQDDLMVSIQQGEKQLIKSRTVSYRDNACAIN